MPSVRLFNSDSPKLPFLAGEAGVGMIWNGEAYMAAQEDSSIVYVYPREGAILWMDNLAIPQKAGHVEEAHRLIDFLLRPEIARLICEEIGYASPNRAAVELLDPELRNNRTVYPRDEDLKGAEYQVDVGEAIALYQKYWEKLKTGR
jgi:spermidine/putrescine transport system substrate-binding protein